MRFKLVEKFDDTDISIILKETVGKLIIDEYEAINGYEQGIKFLEDNKYDEDIIKVLDDIMREENRHVGQLQEVLKMISPAAEEIAAGEQEGREQLGEQMISERKNKPQDEKESASVRRYIDIIKANPYYELSDNTLYAGKTSFKLTDAVYKRLKELESEGKLQENLTKEEIVRLTNDEFANLPQEERKRLLQSDTERKELEKAINYIGKLVNQSNDSWYKDSWKLIKKHLDRDVGLQLKIEESLVTEIYPNKGEDKKHFIARFMSATKDEYPDVKQRFAVANSYWDRKDKVNEEFNEEIIKGQFVLNDQQKDFILSDLFDDPDIYDVNSEWVISSDKTLDPDRTESDDKYFPYVLLIDGKFVDALAKEYINKLMQLGKNSKVNENFEIVKNDVEVFDTYNGLDATIDLKLSNEDKDKLKDIGWSTTFKDSKGNDISDSDIIKTELYILDDMNYGTAIYININDDLDLIRIGETSKHLLKDYKVDFDAISRFVSNFFNRNKVNEIFTPVKIDSKVKDWYKKDYADDKFGDEINDDITFEDVDKALDDKKDIYDFIGVHDSIVRERIFDRLAHIKHVDYDDIYSKWLSSYDDLKESFSEDALIPLAEYLYDNLHISFDRRGNISYDEDDFYSYEDIKEYYDDRIDRKTYNKALKLLKDGLKSAEFYQGDLSEPMLELSDRSLMNEVTPKLSEDEYEAFDQLYWEVADKKLEELEDKFGTEFGYAGRSGRHVVVENNVKNLIRYNELKDALQKAQDEFVSYMSNRENWKN